jgi:hypothetical protein
MVGLDQDHVSAANPAVTLIMSETKGRNVEASDLTSTQPRLAPVASTPVAMGADASVTNPVVMSYACDATTSGLSEVKPRAGRNDASRYPSGGTRERHIPQGGLCAAQGCLPTTGQFHFRQL